MNSTSELRIRHQQELIRLFVERENVTRTELARLLGWSKPAVADYVEQLLEVGLIREAGEGIPSKKGGRKPRLLSLNRRYCLIAGMDFSLHQPVVALADLGGEILQQEALLELAQSDDPVGMLNAALHRLLRAEDTPPEKVGRSEYLPPGCTMSGRSWWG